MQLVMVLFPENPVECWWDFNPRHCEILRTHVILTYVPYLICWFLADRTIGRAYGTVCRLSVCHLSVCL